MTDWAELSKKAVPILDTFGSFGIVDWDDVFCVSGYGKMLKNKFGIPKGYMVNMEVQKDLSIKITYADKNNIKKYKKTLADMSENGEKLPKVVTNLWWTYPIAKTKTIKLILDHESIE